MEPADCRRHMKPGFKAFLKSVSFHVLLAVLALSSCSFRSLLLMCKILWILEKISPSIITDTESPIKADTGKPGLKIRKQVREVLLSNV